MDYTGQLNNTYLQNMENVYNINKEENDLLENGIGFELNHHMQIMVPPQLDGFQLDSNYFNIDEMRKNWLFLFNNEQLGINETIRFVYFVTDKNTKEQIIQGTFKSPINSFNEFINAIKFLQERNKNCYIGISIGGMVYDTTLIDQKSAPSLKAWKYTNNMVIDIDCYKSQAKSQKDRLNVNILSKDQQTILAVQIYNKIVQKLIEKDCYYFKPNMVSCTGGGFQIYLKFDRNLNKEEASKIFNMYKDILTRNNERFKIVCASEDSNSLFTSGVFEGYAEIDSTFADITHVQRFLGMKNQKYNFMPTDLTDVFNKIENKATGLLQKSDVENINSHIYKIIDPLKQFVLDTDSDFVKELISKKGPEEYKKYVMEYVGCFKILEEHISNLLLLPPSVEDYLSHANFMHKPNAIINESIKIDQTLNDILLKLNWGVVEPIIRDHLIIEKELSSYVVIRCPFHEESTGSHAIYKNEGGKILFNDFHDSQTYNIVTFWMAFKNIDKQTAISQLVSMTGVTFNSQDSKKFQKALDTLTVNELLDNINITDFLYYRLANKQKLCILRHIESGETFGFDGPKVLADHILDNQLKYKGVDFEFREAFQDAFIQKILIDAFEEFNPGASSTYMRNTVQFVNTWIPGINYKNTHMLAKELDEMTMEESVEIMKKQTPWLYKYLLQMTQKGNLFYFINWLAHSARFIPVPTMPILTSNFGTGKNVFVDEVLNFYFNQEYVHVMNSDRVHSQFNSQLETCSLLVLDEGDFNKTKEVDNLKFLTGNNTIMIEKKGIDTQKKKKWFNAIMLTNGTSPITHPINDRRFTYFRLEVTLLELCNELNTTISQFIENIRKELTDFWAIILKTKINTNWGFQNFKDGQFYKQILLMHPFGNLILKILNDEWLNIKLLLNENVHEKIAQKMNIELIDNIEKEFKSTGKISLALANMYIKAANFKSYQNIQQFIDINHLYEHGISITIEDDEVIININKNKILNLIHTTNNLIEIIPEYFQRNTNNEKKSSIPLNMVDVIEPSLGNNDILNINNPTLPNIPGFNLPGM